MPDRPLINAELDELVEFICCEAQLIDALRLDEWLALFAEDGHYWVPGHPGQTDPLLEPSLAYEDRLLLQIRIDRLRHPQAHSQKPASRCVHVLQTPRLTDNSAPDVRTPAEHPTFTLRTPFCYTEQRARRQISLTGVATHLLARIDGTLRIKSKRVDLLGADSALPMIQLFP